MLFSIILIIIIIIHFIIYIEGSMSIFLIYIGIARPHFHFDYTNFKVSLVIKIINFNEIKKKSHLIMLVIFHVDVISCQNFYIPHIYCIFAQKIIFWDENLQISHMVSKRGSYYVKWHGSTFIKTKNHLNYFWNIFMFLNAYVHYIRLHKYTLISYFIKWNEIILFLMSCLGYILT
jgi:hypothetical protein